MYNNWLLFKWDNKDETLKYVFNRLNNYAKFELNKVQNDQLKISKINKNNTIEDKYISVGDVISIRIN